MGARWLTVLIVAVVLVLAPLAVRARPVVAPAVAPVELATRILQSHSLGWSGYVESRGSLQIPTSTSFANLAQLLGESNDLRVWWRGPDDWRVDRLRSTGETDLFRHGSQTVRWVFESRTATITPVSRIRLPDASDLLPPTLARTVLEGFRPAELTPLPPRRLAGASAVGLRLTPNEAAASLAHVDLWADPRTGLALGVELYAPDNPRPVLTTTLRTFEPQMPAPEFTAFVPDPDVKLDVEQSVDVAAAAHALGSGELPRVLGGLRPRNEMPGAVGVYGRGPTNLIAIPLRGQVAGPLRHQLRTSAAAEETEVGVLAPIGPISVLLTPFQAGRGSYLLTGTVSPDTVRRAASELVSAA
jgi:outer membrane lipoprotein-sorting protein